MAERRQPEAKAPRRRRAIRHYRQTTNFTCGPSSLLMAMNAQDRGVRLERSEELQIWREANTVFMGPRGGHAGCSALGLALAAHRRGFRAEVRVNHRGPLLGERSRKPALMEVTRLMHERDLAEARAAGIDIAYDVPEPDELATLIAAGVIPIVLVTCWYIDRSHTPHWVVVTGVRDHEVSINDPWVLLDAGETARAKTNLAVPRRTFDKMTRYGPGKERATVLIGPRSGAGGRVGVARRRC
jgi:predicted double-glycine peptidase